LIGLLAALPKEWGDPRSGRAEPPVKAPSPLTGNGPSRRIELPARWSPSRNTGSAGTRPFRCC